MTNSVVTAHCHRHPCQDFATSMPATSGLIAGPWTPLAFPCCRGRESTWAVVNVHVCCPLLITVPARWSCRLIPSLSEETRHE